MSNVNTSRLRTQGLKLQRIGTRKQTQKARRDDQRQSYSDQLVEAMSTSSAQSLNNEDATKNEDNIFAMVAAVLAPHVVEKVGHVALQELADNHGASLTLGRNTVVMGPQHVVDSVKQELVALAEKAEVESACKMDDTLQNSTEDSAVDAIPQDTGSAPENITHFSSASQDSTREQSSATAKRSKRRTMPPLANSTKRRKIIKSPEENNDNMNSGVNADTLNASSDTLGTAHTDTVNTETMETVDLEPATEEESQIIEPISLKSVTKNLNDYELVYMEDEDTLELVKHSTEKKEPNAEGIICEHCGYQAKNAQTLYLHQKTFHQQSQHNFKCDICFGTFGFASALRVHRQRHYENDDVTLKASAIIVHLQRRDGKDVVLEDSDREQIEKYERDMALLKQKPIVRLAKVKGTQATGLVQENTVREIESKEAETEPDEIVCDQDVAPEKILRLIKEKKAASATEYQCMFCQTILHSQLALSKHITMLHFDQSKEGDTKRTMMRHRASTGISIHNPDDVYQCSLCDFKCSRMQNFTRHVKNHENPDLYRCDECPYTNTRRCEVLRHKRNNHGEPKLECTYCHKMFRTQATLNTHIAARHTKKYAEQCEVCGLVLSSKLALRKHVQRNHSNDELMEKTHITCNKCGRGFKRKKEFLDHINEFHSNTIGDNTQNENVVLEDDGSCFRCGVCHTYKNKSAREVRKHIERLHCPKDKMCELCDKTFATEALLVKHTETIHLLKELSKCTLCNKTFKTKGKLRMHETRVHSGVKRFACEVCNRQFLEKQQWKKHIEVHLPEDERTWRYACDICGKRYRYKYNYDYHMIDHSDQPHAFTCQTCGRGFKAKHQLDAHMTTHSEERPFVCTSCGRGFKRRKYLDVHMLAHASEKFVCQACGRLFVSSVHLQRHLCKAVVIKAPLVNDEEVNAGSQQQSLFIISSSEGGEQTETWAAGEQVVQIQDGQDGSGFLDDDIMGQILQSGQLALLNGEVVRIEHGGSIEQQHGESIEQQHRGLIEQQDGGLIEEQHGVSIEQQHGVSIEQQHEGWMEQQPQEQVQVVEFQQGVKLEKQETELEQSGEEVQLEQQGRGYIIQQGETIMKLEQQDMKEQGEEDLQLEQPAEEDIEIEEEGTEGSHKAEQSTEEVEIIRELVEQRRRVIELDPHEGSIQIQNSGRGVQIVQQLIEQQTGQKVLIIGEQQLVEQAGESHEQSG